MKKEKFSCSPLHEWCDPINDSSYMYRTQYMVMSRTLLEAMPKEWQHRWVKMIDEIHQEFDVNHKDWIAPRYQVKAVNSKGQYTRDPWGNYRYPDTKWIEQFRIKK